MKNLLLLVFCFLMSTSVFSQIEVEEKQRSIITKVTATWCPNCGTWGWSFFKDLIAENDEKATLIAAHYSGELMTSAGQALGTNFNASGQPNFFVDNARISATSSNWSSKKADIKADIDARWTEAPIANTGIEMSINPDGALDIKTRTLFFEDTEGEYYLGVYVLENNHVFYQSPIGNNAVHEKTLRTAATPSSAFGIEIKNGSISAGEEVLENYTIPVSPSWNVDDIEVAAIIWKKSGAKYDFVNTFSVTEFDEFVKTDDFLSKDAYSVVPNLSNELITILVDSGLENAAASVQVFDFSGQLLRDVYNGEIRGQHSLEVKKSDLGISNGTYLIHINLDGKRAIEKIVFVD